MKLIDHRVSLEWITPGAAGHVERAGRTCYKSEPKEGGSEDFVRSIINRGHESVLEHAVASFRIITDRGITHELVRHRIASFSQESTRYCNYAGDRFGGEIQFIRPVELPEVAWTLWMEAMASAERYYLELLSMGVKPQDARSVLPTATKTEIVMTANLREWRHMLSLRKPKAAHPDMRVVAQAIYDILQEQAPAFLHNFKERG